MHTHAHNTFATTLPRLITHSIRHLNMVLELASLDSQNDLDYLFADLLDYIIFWI